MFTLAPFSPMLVQCVQSRIGGVLPFFPEKTEDRDDEKRKDDGKTQELENEDDGSSGSLYVVLYSRYQTRLGDAGSGLAGGVRVLRVGGGRKARTECFNWS